MQLEQVADNNTEKQYLQIPLLSSLLLLSKAVRFRYCTLRRLTV